MIVRQDEYGNRFSIEGGTFFLILKSDRKKRQLGMFSRRTGILLIHRSKRKHLHKATQSYGFNKQMLEEASKMGIKKIRLVDEEATYDISPLFILSYGNPVSFGAVGYEQQLFLSLKILETLKK